MAIEYKIKFDVPKNYTVSQSFINKMPSPIHQKTMSEIYNFKIEKDGFYFIDSLVEQKISSLAFKYFVDEALANSSSIQIIKL